MKISASIWRLVKRTQEIIVPPQCYKVANDLANIVQSAGLNADLCVGEFDVAYSNVRACTSKYSAYTTILSTYSGLDKAIDLCSVSVSSILASIYSAETSATLATSCLSVNGGTYCVDYLKSLILSANSASSVSLCNSYESVGSSPPASLNITCIPHSTISLTSQVSTSLSTSTPTATGVSVQTSTPSATATIASSQSLSTGAVAGIAVGATMVGILVLALIGFFIWRRRRTANKRKQAEALATLDSRSPEAEKAQLHGDSYQVERKELEGSKVPRKVRVVPGLNELEYRDLKNTRGEMNVNEIAAGELSGNTTNSVGDSSRSMGTGETTLNEQRMEGGSR